MSAEWTEVVLHLLCNSQHDVDMHRLSLLERQCESSRYALVWTIYMLDLRRVPLFFLALLLAALNAHAKSLQLPTDAPQVDVVPYLQFYEDQAGTLEIADLLARQDWTVPTQKKEVVDLGYSDSVWWLRLDIETEMAVSRFLEIGYPTLDSVELFAPNARGKYLHMRTGDLLPFSQRLLPHHNLVFPIELPAGKFSLYLRVSSRGAVTIPAVLWAPQAFHLHNQVSYAALAVYYGMLLALGSYNLLLYFSLRDKTYLFYVLFLASMAVGISSLDGLAGQFLWPDWPKWTNLALPIGMAMSGLLAANFVRLFLDTRQALPRTDAILKFFMAWYVAAIVLNVVSYQWAEMMTSLASMCFSTTTLVIGIVSYRRGHAGARYFVLAWTFLLSGSIMLSVRNFGWIPTNFITRHGFQIGSALEMLLLSYALADRITALRLDKERADARLLQLQEANVAALKRSEQELERRVAERTRELAAANAKLEVLSHHDALTGLGNRNELDEAWNRMEGYAKRSNRGIAVILMDLNDFKPINDVHGHHVGDYVLKEVANRLRRNTRATDTVVRLGGDEFIVLVSDITSKDEIDPIKDKISEVIGEPIQAGNIALTVGCSIGVALYPTEATTLAELLQQADSVMYQNKRHKALSS